MKESKFQFTNPFLKSLNYKLNDNFRISESGETKLPLNLKVNVRKENRRLAMVFLTLTLGEDNGNAPFYICATEAARFRWEKDMDEFSDDLLNSNAPALLLSYLRPVVAQITAASPFGAYNLPFMDFTKGTNRSDEK